MAVCPDASRREHNNILATIIVFVKFGITLHLFVLRTHIKQIAISESAICIYLVGKVKTEVASTGNFPFK